jgi:anti-anti-sigma regulatory factor
MKTPTIHLFKQAIAFRDDAEEIEKQAKKSAKKSPVVYLDFKEVKFISRSFADELINSMERLKKSDISLKIRNAAPNVKKMLSLVRQTRRSILKKAGTFNISV